MNSLGFALLLTAAPAFASDSGASTAHFLRQGAGARALGMGEAYGPVAEGPDSLYWNPAGLAKTGRPELSYSHTETQRFFHHEYLAYAHPLPSLDLAIGAAATLLYQDPLPVVTGDNITVNTFRPHSEAYSLGIARDDGGPLLVGLAVKTIQETLYGKSPVAVAFDGGMLFRARKGGGLSLSLAFRNAGATGRYYSQEALLPAELNIGAAYDARMESHHLLPALEVTLPYKGPISGKAGLEYSVLAGRKVRVAMRGGYKVLSGQSPKGVAGFTTGLGLKLPRLSVDFSFQPMVERGQAYTLSLGLRF